VSSDYKNYLNVESVFILRPPANKRTGSSGFGPVAAIAAN